jgi:hypothetical protein
MAKLITSLFHSQTKDDEIEALTNKLHPFFSHVASREAMMSFVPDLVVSCRNKADKNDNTERTATFLCRAFYAATGKTVPLQFREVEWVSLSTSYDKDWWKKDKAIVARELSRLGDNVGVVNIVSNDCFDLGLQNLFPIRFGARGPRGLRGANFGEMISMSVKVESWDEIRTSPQILPYARCADTSMRFKRQDFE